MSGFEREGFESGQARWPVSSEAIDSSTTYGVGRHRGIGQSLALMRWIDLGFCLGGKNGCTVPRTME
jgi:hypothetical protein